MLKIRGNIIELIFGAVLLWFCINYLGSHPAEKTSIISGAELMYQKIQVFVGNVFYGDGTLRKEQQDLVRTYGDIISQVKDMKCEWMVSVSLIEQKLQQLKQLSPTQFKLVKETYKMFISGQYLKIKELCGTK